MGLQGIYVGSVTNAMRGRRLLEEKGIRAEVRRLSHPGAGDGCGYVLTVSGRLDTALTVLNRGNVRVLRVGNAP